MPVSPLLASPVPRTSPSIGKDTYPKPRGEGITTTNPDATQVPLTPHPTPAIASQNDECVVTNQPSSEEQKGPADHAMQPDNAVAPNSMQEIAKQQYCPPVSSRPKRITRAPPTYDAQSGKWVR